MSFIISEVLYKDLSTLGNTLPCLAIIDLPKTASTIDYSVDTLILENVQDPGNVGTLLRSAAAKYKTDYLHTRFCLTLVSTSFKSRYGAHFSLSCFENFQLTDILPKFDIPVFVTSSHRSTSLLFKKTFQNHVFGF